MPEFPGFHFFWTFLDSKKLSMSLLRKRTLLPLPLPSFIKGISLSLINLSKVAEAILKYSQTSFLTNNLSSDTKGILFIC